MSNSYKVSITTPFQHDGMFSFRAQSLPEAYEIAARRIIDSYDIPEEDCVLLEEADVKSWNRVCDTIYSDTGYDISDVEEYEES